jgi:hypothetical protein
MGATYACYIQWVEARGCLSVLCCQAPCTYSTDTYAFFNLWDVSRPCSVLQQTVDSTAGSASLQCRTALRARVWHSTLAMMRGGMSRPEAQSGHREHVWYVQA